MRRWLHEGLKTSAQVRVYCPSKTAQMQFIKCQFYISQEPFWAWLCSVLDNQDAIKELLNCVLACFDTLLRICFEVLKTVGPWLIGPPTLRFPLFLLDY